MKKYQLIAKLCVALSIILSGVTGYYGSALVSLLFTIMISVSVLFLCWAENPEHFKIK